MYVLSLVMFQGTVSKFFKYIITGFPFKLNGLYFLGSLVTVETRELLAIYAEWTISLVLFILWKR